MKKAFIREHFTRLTNDIFLSIRITVAVLAILLGFTSACSQTPSTQTPTLTTPPANVLRSVIGAITSIDLQKRQVVVFDMVSKTSYTLSVNDATQIMRNGRIVSLSELVGLNVMMDVIFDPVTMVAIKIVSAPEVPPPSTPGG